MVRGSKVSKRRKRVMTVEVSENLYEVFNQYVGRYFNSPEEAVVHCMKTMVLLRHKALREKKASRSL